METFYSESDLEQIKGLEKAVNEYQNRWLDNYLLYGPRKTTFMYKIRYFIFKWQMRIENAWNALRGRDNW